MKKSELIEKLNAIEGDFEITFAVDTDLLMDEWSFVYTDGVGDMELKTLYYEKDEIYSSKKDLEEYYKDAFNDGVMKGEELQKKVDEAISRLMKKEAIVIEITT